MDRIWLPYCGEAPLPAEWLARWNLDLVVIAALLACGVLAWRKAEKRTAILWAFLVLALLFISPICALSSALFSVRVAHHIALTAIAAPLLVFGLGERFRLPGPVSIWAALHILSFWFWHAPDAYAFALSSDAGYWLMQATLLASALGFWAALRTSGAPTVIGLLLVMMVQMGLLGALITFAGSPLYAPHWLTTQAWGLAPLEDQQLAGLIMWAPASLFYLAAALWTGWRLLGPNPPASQSAAT